MDHFSFVMVLLSIIVGLGVTELLTNVARQIQYRKTTKPYWLHSVIVALVFISLLQQWWESWGLQGETAWSFPVLLLMIAGPVGIYIISHLLFPEEIDGANFDTHYHDNSRVIAILGIFAVVSAGLFRPLSFGDSLIDPGNIASLVLLVSFIFLAVTNNRKVHQTILPVLLVLNLADILVFTLRI